MDYREFLEDQLQKASELALGYFGKVSTTVKAGDQNQVLTEADIAIGKQLVDAVLDIYPDHNIIDEEAGVIDKGSRYTWVIDPIDGTSNFAAGTPDYGIMIGLLEGDVPVAGGVATPAHGNIYIAEKNKGATRNGQIIRVTDEKNLLNVLLSFGIDGHIDMPEQTVNDSSVFSDLVLNVRNIRNSGSEAIDPMYVAEGRYGGRVNTSSKMWDNVAPQVIAEEAGALWTDPNGVRINYADPVKRVDQNFSFCVAPPMLHGKLIEIINGRLQVYSSEHIH